MSKLTQISVGNFKAFGSKQQVPIKPITLIYGQNSSGKSSIIDALLFSSHLARTGIPCELGQYFDDAYFDFEITGNKVRLGRFEDLAHGKDDQANISIGFSLGLGNSSQTVTTSLSFEGISSYAVESPLGSSFYSLAEDNIEGGNFFDPFPVCKYSVKADCPLIEPAINTAIEATSAFLRKFCTENRKSDAAKLLKRYTSKESLEKIVNRVEIEKEVISLFESPPASLGTFPPTIVQGDFRNLYNVMSPLEIGGKSTDFYVPNGVVEPRIPTDLGSALGNELERLIVSLAFRELELRRVNCSRDLKEMLRNIAYCGPYREGIDFATLFPESMIAHDGLSSEFRVGGWTFGETAVAYLNGWLKSVGRSEAWYELKVEDNRDGESDVPGLRIRLFDKKRKLEVSLHEIGSGVGQLIPILLTAAGYKNSIVCVKQPELHLHPALQAEVADVFVERSSHIKGYDGNTFLLETHSEHILLRILRRIRQTKRGEAPEGLRLSASDVSVLYVENRGQQSVVHQMPISADGELQRDWPGGFFEEGLREVLY